MPTKSEIENQYIIKHDSLTKAYYIDKILNKADFLSAHFVLWLETEQALVDNGYFIRPPSPPDWKALWLAADTGTVAERIAKKIAVLAKKEGLE